MILASFFSILILLLFFPCHYSLSVQEQQGLAHFVSEGWILQPECVSPHVVCVDEHVREINFSHQKFSGCIPRFLPFFSEFLIKLDLSSNKLVVKCEKSNQEENEEQDVAGGLKVEKEAENYKTKVSFGREENDNNNKEEEERKKEAEEDEEEELLFLSYLINLKELYLSNNHLNCSLRFLKNLTSLQTLNLENNFFRGDLQVFSSSSSSFSSSPFINLTSIQLGNNELLGNLSFLRTLTHLTYLDLSSNYFTGSLTHLQNFSSLQYLYLWSNSLQGNLSFSIENLFSLIDLSLYDNHFFGSLSPLQNLTNLRLLDFDLNEFSGDLFPLHNLYSLEGIFMWHNNITHTLEPLQNLTHLKRISLDTNALTGALFYLKNLVNLEWLFLDDNFFNGDLLFLTNLTKLNRLTLSANKNLKGEVFPLKNLRNLTRVDLSDNQLFGSLEPLKNCIHLKFLNLSHNRLRNSSSSSKSDSSSIRRSSESGRSSSNSDDKDSYKSNEEEEEEAAEAESLSIIFPSLVLLDLSYNAFQETHLISLNLNPAGSVALLKGEDSFSCPLPETSHQKMAFVHDFCTPNEAVFLPFLIGFPCLLLILLFLACCVYCLQTSFLHNILRYRSSKRGKFFIFLIIFFLSVQDFTLDVLFMIRMLKDLELEDFCAPINDREIFPYLLAWNFEYNGEPFPKNFHSFSSYLEQINLYFPDDVEAVRKDFRIQCELLAESSPTSSWAIFKPATCSCMYSNDLCIYQPSKEDPFRTVVLIVITLSTTKEMLKVLVICIALIKGYIPHRLCHFVLNSFLAPLLKFRPQLFEKMINYQPAASDFLLALIYDGLCEDCIQLFVAVYFAQFVSQTGLDWIGYLSISSTLLSTIVLLARALAAYCTSTSASRRQNGAARLTASNTELQWNSSIASESEFEFNRLDDS